MKNTVDETQPATFIMATVGNVCLCAHAHSHMHVQVSPCEPASHVALQPELSAMTLLCLNAASVYMFPLLIAALANVFL